MYPLGKIAKTHGYGGTLVVVNNAGLGDLNPGTFLFVVIDGLHVPFRVEDFDLITNTSAHVQLGLVSCQEDAKKLVGCELFSEIAPRVQEDETEANFEQWTGFTVHDTKYGKAGIVQKIENYNGNIVMQLIDGKKETLISIYPELVISSDNVAKTLYITAPDGYFLINS